MISVTVFAVMNDIRRQEDPKLLGAVLDTIKGHIYAAFEKVGDGISAHGENAPQKAAEAWLALSPQERADTLLITQSNDWRRSINSTGTVPKVGVKLHVWPQPIYH